MITERYYDTLKDIHSLMTPENYLEIGVRHGDSWQLINQRTKSIGIDPQPRLKEDPPGKAHLFVGTSDDFFANHDPKQILGDSLELSFIDGMHHFEYALRDFANIERYSRKSSTILIHDCLPIDEISANRDQTTDVWTGDIWKVVVCLKETRPDLKIDVLDVTPSGLGVIQNLNPDKYDWRNNLDEIIARFIDLPFSYLGDEECMRTILNAREITPEILQSLFGRSNISISDCN